MFHCFCAFCKLRSLLSVPKFGAWLEVFGLDGLDATWHHWTLGVGFSASALPSVLASLLPGFAENDSDWSLSYSKQNIFKMIKKAPVYSLLTCLLCQAFFVFFAAWVRSRWWRALLSKSWHRRTLPELPAALEEFGSSWFKSQKNVCTAQVLNMIGVHPAVVQENIERWESNMYGLPIFLAETCTNSKKTHMSLNRVWNWTFKGAWCSFQSTCLTCLGANSRLAVNGWLKPALASASVKTGNRMHLQFALGLLIPHW